MRNRRAKEIRRLVYPKATGGVIADVVIEADNAVILIKGANADSIARALEKRPKEVKKLVKELKKKRQKKQEVLYETRS